MLAKLDSDTNPIEKPLEDEDLETPSLSDNSDSLMSENSSYHPEGDEVDYLTGYNELTYEQTNTGNPVLDMERLKTFESLSEGIPDKFSGWGLLSVIGCFLFNFNTWGANSAYALYLQEYIHSNAFPGTSKLIYGTIGGVAFGSGLMLGPLINYLTGLLGIKPTVLLGTVVQFIGVLLASFSTKTWELACTQGLLQGIGMALTAVPNIVIVPQWFKGGPGGKRNLAMGIVTGGSGIGGIVYNIGMQPIMEKSGWQWSLRTQAIMCFVLNICALMMIKSRNSEIKPVYKLYDKKVFHTFGSQVMMVWEVFSLFGYVVLMYNLGDFTRAMGYSSQQGSIVSTMVAVGIVYGRPIAGELADIIGPIHLSIITSWLVGIFALVWWIPCKNFATALVFALFEGSLMGTVFITMPTINGAIIGLAKFGIGMSLSWVSMGVAGFVSPIIGISLKGDGPPSRLQYTHPAIFVGCVYIAAGLSMCVLRGWVISRNELAKGVKTEDERLELRVPVKMAIRNIFNFGKYKV